MFRRALCLLLVAHTALFQGTGLAHCHAEADGAATPHIHAGDFLSWLSLGSAEADCPNDRDSGHEHCHHHHGHHHHHHHGECDEVKEGTRPAPHDPHGQGDAVPVPQALVDGTTSVRPLSWSATACDLSIHAYCLVFVPIALMSARTAPTPFLRALYDCPLFLRKLSLLI